ncbi:MAG: hypothetical protein ACRDTF_24695 [Pseudonocardiaceae bacterium]
MPPQRRSPVARRPRVAGRHPGRPVFTPSQASAGGSGLGNGTGTPAEQAIEVVEVPGRKPALTTTVAALVIGVAVVVIALGLVAWFRGETEQLTGSAAPSNVALIDAGTTAQVSGQVRDAVERIYSYDFTRLDDNERAAREVITGPFIEDFGEQFDRVRELAPQQQAVVVATVADLAVKRLDGDRAIVMVFIDQQASRGNQAQPLQVAGRLIVTAERVADSWKIAEVQPF